MEEILKKNYKWIVAGIMTLFFVVSALNAYNDSHIRRSGPHSCGL
jgi:hypothetical protein